MRHLQAPHNGLARAVGVQLPQATFPVTRRRLSTQRNQHGGTARTAQPRQRQTDRQTGQPGPSPAWPEASLHTTSWLLEETLPGLRVSPAHHQGLDQCTSVCPRVYPGVRCRLPVHTGTSSVGRPRLASRLCSQVVPRTLARANTGLLPRHGLLPKPPSKSWTRLQPLLTGATNTQGRPALTPPVLSPSAQPPQCA